LFNLNLTYSAFVAVIELKVNIQLPVCFDIDIKYLHNLMPIWQKIFKKAKFIHLSYHTNQQQIDNNLIS